MVFFRDNIYLPWNLREEPTKKQPTCPSELFKFTGLKCAFPKEPHTGFANVRRRNS